jgi:CDP-glycerol glycerophosphotransferase (TagB/SpsB family)/glycosyltransferase involved in cell wall biosynthesis
LRKVAGRTLAGRRRRNQRPELTVVMPVYNVAPYLREALDSVLTSSLRNLELIAVDDGSTDECLEILRSYERGDYRVRVFTQTNSGQGIARNVGVGHARAEFLTFIDSDDTVPPSSFAHMLETLRASGSDFCVGGVRRFRHRQYMRTTWKRTVHQTERIGTTLEEFPAAMQEIIACNRVFRTAFWRDQIGDFRGGIAYEDHVPMLAAYVRSKKFDILSEVTYNWRIRDDSTGQQKAKLQNLLDRIEVKAEAHELLKAEASEFVYDLWVARCLEVDFGPFVAQALDAEEEYRETVAKVYRLFNSRATERVWDLVRVLPKVRAYLVAAGRWTDVDESNQWFLSVHQVPPTAVIDGVLTAVLPSGVAWAVDLPAYLLRMASLESHFEGVVQQITWTNDGHAELTGWMRHRGLDIDDPAIETEAPMMALSLRCGEQAIELSFQHEVHSEANLWFPLPYSGCANAGFRAQIPIADLTPGNLWSLHGSITVDSMTSEGTFHDPIAGSSAEHPAAREVLLGARRVGVRPVWDPSHGFSFGVREGGLQKVPAVPRGALVEQITIDHDEIAIQFSGASEAVLRGTELRNPRTVLTPFDWSQGQVRFSTKVTEFGSEPHPAPSGGYSLTVRGRPAQPSTDFAASFPVRLVGDTFGLIITTAKTDPVRIAVTAPISDEQQGLYNQFRLHAGYQASKAPLNRSILLASYLGEFTTDSQFAIDRYLAEHQPDLERIWGVADSSTAVPPGARSVLIDSPAWYEAVATSRFLAKNIDFGPWYRTRPGQAYLQTFHGYPFKTMGRDFWKSKAYSPSQIKHSIAKVNSEWDLILVPNAECESYYREQYEYDGAILTAGYPRTDALINTDAAAVRRTVLDRIGVDQDKTVVLYAPTYRDTLTTKTYAASIFDELDLKKLTDSLGKKYVVLVRGHNNNQRDVGRVPRAGTVVDVTDYPEINELTLAADVAVLDYSSLRFDWAITGKPVVFFVPDHESYFGVRPPLFSFEESTPGPWAIGTSEVAAALSDLDALRTQFGPTIAAFNQRFNGLHDGRATERVLATLLDESTPWRDR